MPFINTKSKVLLDYEYAGSLTANCVVHCPKLCPRRALRTLQSPDPLFFSRFNRYSLDRNRETDYMDSTKGRMTMSSPCTGSYKDEILSRKKMLDFCNQVRVMGTAGSVGPKGDQHSSGAYSECQL